MRPRGPLCRSGEKEHAMNGLYVIGGLLAFGLLLYLMLALLKPEWFG